MGDLTKSALDEREAAKLAVPDHVQDAIRTLIEWAGDDPAREGLLDTPKRVARAWKEYCQGYDEDPAVHLSRTFEEVGGYNELVLLKDIPFQSHCEHHMAPFFGKAHIAYIPAADGRVCGLSKLARLVEVYAKRPQVQERLTSQIADTLVEQLNPQGVVVVLEAEHMCMSMRGVKKPGSHTVTSAVRGVFAGSTDAARASRTEAMSLILRETR